MNIFVNREQKRLRAGWRVLIQLFCFFGMLIGLSFAVRPLGRGPEAQIVGSIAYIIGGLALAWLLARFLDKRPFADFGFHLKAGWWVDFVFGLVLGAALLSAVFVTFQMAGWVTITHFEVTRFRIPFAEAFLVDLLGFIAVGINEELAFRGYLLKNMAEGFSGKRIGPRAAIVLAFVVSSALFGFAHATNPGATVLSTANVALAGLLLGLPYMLTGELSMAIGIHIAWNLFEGTVFGFAVSGGAPPTHLIDLDVHGPELWTGGAFGPEGGLCAVIWILVACVVILIWNRFRRGNIKLATKVATYEPRIALKAAS